MKQVLQSLKTGATELAELPCPSVGPKELLIRTTRSLVSAGTERMLVEFGQSGWIEKARAQPDKVQQVLQKVQTDGLLPTLEAVQNKLSQPLALGYCNVGVVLACGSPGLGLLPGDRVASNGKHAQVVSVPNLLCAKIPPTVSDEEASFTVLGAIALQGIRLANPTLGETVVVTGLGLIGLLTVQLLKANGCEVIGIDQDPHKLALAQEFGAQVINIGAGQNPVTLAKELTRGQGVDAVIITASTSSNAVMHEAAQMSRKRGRIILVGVVGLELSRADFYEKELSFQVSCSYGPGRYDPLYEREGVDYPLGYVRWTEQRNFEAVLTMMAAGRLNVKPLISHRLPFEHAEEAYRLITSQEPSLGIVFEYPKTSEITDAQLQSSSISLVTASKVAQPVATTGAVTVGVIGAGNYAVSRLLPAFAKTNARMVAIASRTGVSSVQAGKKFGFEEAVTNIALILDNQKINTLVVATQHDSHASLVELGLKAGKHVFVEKPLCIHLSELQSISQLYRSIEPTQRPCLMVGFNRRFAPQIQKIKSLLDPISLPKSLILTINAGHIDQSHWTQDMHIGGGRIVGEVCHFIDLARHLVGHSIVGHSVYAMALPTDHGSPDSVMISLQFADGSIASIQYLSNGSKAFPKERIEIFCDGKILALDNFRKLHAFGWTGFKSMHLLRQDKGQLACVQSFVKALEQGGPPPIPFEELEEVARVTLEIASEAH